MATSVEQIEIIDAETGNVLGRIGEVGKPLPEGTQAIPLSITQAVKEIYVYAIAWLSTGWFSKASDKIKLIINAISKYPMLASYVVERPETTSLNLDFTYNVEATFDVNKDFEFEISKRSISLPIWQNTLLDYTKITKSDNDFSYTYELETTDNDVYEVRSRMKDVNGDYSNYSPIKTVVKGNILIADEQEAGTIVCFGHAKDAENQIYLII